jgi:xanthine dehydrogenase accessory factor
MMMAARDGSDFFDEDQAALRAAAAGEAALCTVVGIDGSFSRRLGAQLAVTAEGAVVGSLADGCLEGELVTQCARARDSGEISVLRYGRGSPFIDFRLPCGSGIDVLIDPFPNRTMLTKMVAALDSRRAAQYQLATGRSDLLAERDFIPPLRLMIFGVGPEAAQMLRLAHAYGLDAVLHGPGSGLSLGRPPEGVTVDRWTALVLLFHDHEWEGALLEWALGTDALYIGAQGGQLAREARRGQLRDAGHDAPAIERIVSPVGLIRHARNARVLALSILADVVARYEALRD